MTKPTFLLGLGAQKAGTSWLHDYAASDAKSDFGPLKEYHVWDALELPGLGHHDMRPQRPLNRALQRLISTARRRDPAEWRLRGALQADPEHYFDYFAGLLDNPGTRLTGDITPAYAGLSEPTLARIRAGFVSRGVDVKTVFLMRDPVARAISAARMNRRKRDWREGMPPLGDFDRALLRYARSSAQDLRANYARTVGRIRAVFDPGQVWWGFYETMFEPAPPRATVGFPRRCVQARACDAQGLCRQARSCGPCAADHDRAARYP